MNLLIKNTTISKNGSKFLILDVNDRYYLAEQSIDGKVVAYEVGKTVGKKKALDFINRVFSDELYQDIPTVNVFGKNDVDKTFSKIRRADAENYFYKLVNQ